MDKWSTVIDSSSLPNKCVHLENVLLLLQASFSWAWVLDERPEERSRGVTVDVAMARFATDKHSITLLDAPGHRDFVPNMISGAAQADAALLLVDGSPGGFEAGFTGEGAYGQHGGGYGGGGGGGFGAHVAGGQTKEHAQLARSLGVDQMAVVISKLDTCDYSEVRAREGGREGGRAREVRKGGKGDVQQEQLQLHVRQGM